jgi:hypothetical protein
LGGVGVGKCRVPRACAAQPCAPVAPPRCVRHKGHTSRAPWGRRGRLRTGRPPEPPVFRARRASGAAPLGLAFRGPRARTAGPTAPRPPTHRRAAFPRPGTARGRPAWRGATPSTTTKTTRRRWRRTRRPAPTAPPLRGPRRPPAQGWRPTRPSAGRRRCSGAPGCRRRRRCGRSRRPRGAGPRGARAERGWASRTTTRWASVRAPRRPRGSRDYSSAAASRPPPPARARRRRPPRGTRTAEGKLPYYKKGEGWCDHPGCC